MSPDFVNFKQYEEKLSEITLEFVSFLNLFAKDNLSAFFEKIENFPSILFALETALLDLKNGGKRLIFSNKFSTHKYKIPINGLIWMGDVNFMKNQIDEKINQGFACIKMKIGAIDFEKELDLITYIRQKNKNIIIRVDANGAFTKNEALEKMKFLSELNVHSIEQPIKQGQIDDMAEICTKSAIPVALDEELIGVVFKENKEKLLDIIKPPYIILKPSLHGGFYGCEEWISLSERRKIKWWITSALESNIGLNAICQFTSNYENNTFHGLGTGSLYTNNISSNLHVEKGMIFLQNLNKL